MFKDCFNILTFIFFKHVTHADATQGVKFLSVEALFILLEHLSEEQRNGAAHFKTRGRRTGLVYFRVVFFYYNIFLADSFIFALLTFTVSPSGDNLSLAS